MDMMKCNYEIWDLSKWNIEVSRWLVPMCAVHQSSIGLSIDAAWRLWLHTSSFLWDSKWVTLLRCHSDITKTGNVKLINLQQLSGTAPVLPDTQRRKTFVFAVNFKTKVTEHVLLSTTKMTWVYQSKGVYLYFAPTKYEEEKNAWNIQNEWRINHRCLLEENLSHTWRGSVK